MRVITGTARGRRLKTLEGRDVRPTTDRVKEALFSIIQFELEGRTVLDMFAGSGQLGIEALSRGASRAVFVDSDKRAAAVVRENLEHTGLADRAEVYNADSLMFVRNRGERFDIALLDPPYGRGILQRALEAVAPCMAANGVIICELPEKEEVPQRAGNLALFRRYRYGKTELAVYRGGNENEDSDLPREL